MIQQEKGKTNNQLIYGIRIFNCMLSITFMISNVKKLNSFQKMFTIQHKNDVTRT